MAFFLVFLVVVTIFVPMATLSQTGRLAVSVIFALTLIFGAFAIIQHRILIYLVVALAILTLTVALASEFVPSPSSATLETALKLACLSILVFMTLKRTFRPGPITLYRVMGGIAGYLLIGYAWAFAYQLVVEQAPQAIHFPSGATEIGSREPSQLIYFSFATLTTAAYGDVYPLNPAARSLANAEALIGQLYIAILIGSLVGLALQAKSAGVESASITNGSSPERLNPGAAERHSSSPADALGLHRG